MEEPRFDPLDYVSAFNRRKWWFIVPVVISILIGSLLVWKLPRIYQSTAVVAVSSPRVTPNLVSGATDVDRSERMRALSQQLLSRPVLERVVREEHLDAQGSTDRAVNGLRASIGVAMSEGLTPGSTTSNLTPEAKAQLDSYQLIYQDDTPESSQRVLNRLASVFVDENNKMRASRAEDTTAFIEMQLESSRVRLTDVEARLRTAKESYMGRLPEQTNANLQMVAALQRQLESNATAMRGEQDRLSLIERQMQAIEQGIDVGPVGGAAPGMSVQARVVALRNELAAAQLNYTDKHPEVMRLKDELATAEQAASAERTRPLSDRMTVLQANPEYKQLVKDRETTKMRLAELQRQQANANNEIRGYQSRVEAAPRVEQELASLQREYDLERKAYGDLVEKRQTAALQEDLQMRQGGEQFSVLVPANYPTEPFAPKPLRVMLMAIAAGFILGAGGVVGREYLDRSVHDARGLRDEFELPVLAEIPRIEPVMG
jgi:polysaccharide chain length determinant protein (PEP-CTERM system associated)